MKKIQKALNRLSSHLFRFIHPYRFLFDSFSVSPFNRSHISIRFEFGDPSDIWRRILLHCAGGEKSSFSYVVVLRINQNWTWEKPRGVYVNGTTILCTTLDTNLHAWQKSIIRNRFGVRWEALQHGFYYQQILILTSSTRTLERNACTKWI